MAPARRRGARRMPGRPGRPSIWACCAFRKAQSASTRNSVPIVWNRCTAYSTEDTCKGWAAQAKASTGAHHRALSPGTPEISSKLLKNHANAQAVSAWMTMLVVLKRSEEHTSELQSLMRISYAVFCLKKKNV